MSFAYDANGRMVKASKTNTPDAWTVFDALGNRVATKINDVWQFVIYDAFGKLVAEYGMPGEGRGGVSWVLQDWQGSVRASVNSNGFISARFDFTSFGEKISLGIGLRSIEHGYSAPQNSRQGYGLTETDSATGLDHTWFRKNENRAGRWTSPDPYKGSMSLGSSGSFNRYSYVENQPTNFVDPSGLDCFGYFVYYILYYPDTGEIVSVDYLGFIPLFCWDNGPVTSGGSGGGDGSGAGGQGGSNTGSRAVFSRERFNECLSDMFGVTGHFTFDRSLGGRFSGSFFKDTGNIETSGTTDASVTTSFSRDSRQLARDLNTVTGDNWITQSGITLGNSPTVNWIASDVATGVGAYKDVGVLALYIHELGNALGLQTGQRDVFGGYRRENRAAGVTDDDDIGQKFETCVFGGRVGLRSGRIGGSREL